MRIKTNYSGPYRIIAIKRDCTCPTYLDGINMRVPSKQPPHIHLTLTKPGHNGNFYLNHFDEITLKSHDKSYCGGKTIPDYDWITIIENDRPVQKSLF